MFQALIILLTSLGIGSNPDIPQEHPQAQETLQGDQFNPDSDDDEDSKHSTQEGI